MVKIFEKTKSVCPICLKPVDAYKVEREDGIYLDKQCPEHGMFRVLIWKGDQESYQNWDHPAPVSSPTVCQTEVEHGCPYDCGLCPDHEQQICCVVLEVTERCNLRCPVCFASAGGETKEDPSQEEISLWYDRLLQAGGPYNIQLSGGEPTMRDDLPDLIRMGKEKGFTFFQLNSNGLRLAKEPDLAKDLAEAGLNCVFLQFDGVTDAPYEALRGRPLLEEKKRAIENCAEAGLGVVLVPTVAEGINFHQMGQIIQFALDNMPSVRGVHFQPMSHFGRYHKAPEEYRITIPDVLRQIELQTDGRLKASDFIGGGAENSHCSFHGNFMLLPDGVIKAAKMQPTSCCCASSQQSREFVARRWSGKKGSKIRLVPKDGVANGLDSLDAFLEQMEQYTLAVSGMLFQDAWNLDVKRLKSCYILEVSPDGRMIPFCAYNLTSASGETIYRGKPIPKEK